VNNETVRKVGVRRLAKPSLALGQKMFFLRYTIKAEWEQEDGTLVVAELGTIEGERVSLRLMLGSNWET
jgi:hypothetical protein